MYDCVDKFKRWDKFGGSVQDSDYKNKLYSNIRKGGVIKKYIAPNKYNMPNNEDGTNRDLIEFVLFVKTYEGFSKLPRWWQIISIQMCYPSLINTSKIVDLPLYLPRPYNIERFTHCYIKHFRKHDVISISTEHSIYAVLFRLSPRGGHIDDKLNEKQFAAFFEHLTPEFISHVGQAVISVRVTTDSEPFYSGQPFVEAMDNRNVYCLATGDLHLFERAMQHLIALEKKKAPYYCRLLATKEVGVNIKLSDSLTKVFLREVYANPDCWGRYKVNLRIPYTNGMAYIWKFLIDLRDQIIKDFFDKK